MRPISLLHASFAIRLREATWAPSIPRLTRLCGSSTREQTPGATTLLWWEVESRARRRPDELPLEFSASTRLIASRSGSSCGVQVDTRTPPLFNAWPYPQSSLTKTCTRPASARPSPGARPPCHTAPGPGSASTRAFPSTRGACRSTPPRGPSAPSACCTPRIRRR